MKYKVIKTLMLLLLNRIYYIKNCLLWARTVQRDWVVHTTF